MTAMNCTVYDTLQGKKQILPAQLRVHKLDVQRSNVAVFFTQDKLK